jgi:hypothetical protein
VRYQRGDMLADARCVPGLRFDACLRLLDDLPFPLNICTRQALCRCPRPLHGFLDTNTPPPTAAGPAVGAVHSRAVAGVLGRSLDDSSVILGGGAC